MYERIIVGLDGSALAEQVLPHVEDFAQRFDSHILLVRAVHLSAIRSLGRRGAHEEQLIEASIYLEATAQRLRARGFRVEYDTPQEDPAEAIAAAATEADLIALTTHGRSGLGRAVFGSVAQGVLPRAPCPVLVVRASEVSS
jgi:nucleotide-binding universal stress UspA family protein